MQSFSLLLGLAMLLVLGGCATDDPSADDVDAAQAVAESGQADGAAGETPCETVRPDTDIPSPGACAAYALGDIRLAVDYGSPGVKDRDIFGGLVPYGEVWRTGANEATTFSTSGDLLVNGDSLAAGTYGLFTIPTETDWTVIFNGVAEQWGAFDYDAAQDSLRVTATPAPARTPLERFTISFEDGTDGSVVMVLAWDDTRVPVTLSAGG